MVLTATIMKTSQVEVVRTLGLINELRIIRSPSKTNIKYRKSFFISIEDGFGSIVCKLKEERASYPRTIIHCQECEDCADLYLEKSLGSNFTELPNAPHELPQF